MGPGGVALGGRLASIPPPTSPTSETAEEHIHADLVPLSSAGTAESDRPSVPGPLQPPRIVFVMRARTSRSSSRAELRWLPVDCERVLGGGCLRGQKGGAPEDFFQERHAVTPSVRSTTASRSATSRGRVPR